MALALCLPLMAVAVTIAAAAWAISIRWSLFSMVTFGTLLLTLPGWRALEALTERAGEAPPGPPVDEGGLAATVAEVSAALGLKAPQAIHVTIGRGVRVVRFRGRRALVVDLPFVYGVPDGAARVAVAHALLHDAGRLARSLDGRIVQTLYRARAWSGLPVVGVPWRTAVIRLLDDAARARRLRVLAQDEVCVSHFGAPAVAEHVRVLTRAQAFAPYWAGEVVPCLDAGFRPPVLEGWQRFLNEAHVAEHVGERLAAASGEEADAPAPPAAQRLAAIGAAEPADPRRLASTLSDAVLEGIALRSVDAGAARELVEIEWDQVVHAVWLPSLRRDAAAVADALADATVDDLPGLVGALPHQGLGAALAVALFDDGWSLAAQPGGDLRLEREGLTLYPLMVPQSLAGDDVDGWRRFVEDSGIGALALAAPAGTPLLSVPTAAGRAVIRLERTRARRRASIALAVLLSPMVLLFGLAAIVGLMDPLSTPAEQASGAVFAICTVALAGALFLQVRLALSSSSVTIDGHGLRIEDRRLLREAYVIPRERVLAATVDDGEERSVAGNPLRFPFGATTWSDADGWLWHGPDRRSFAMVGLGDEVPNLLLLFDAPLAAPRLRRRRGDALPRRGEQLGGLALKVHDPDLASRVLAGWDVVRPLSHADARTTARLPRRRAS